MNYRIFIIALAFLQHGITRATEIIHITTIADVMQQVEQPTDMVIFDLDETIFTLDHGEYWLEEILKQKKASFAAVKDLYIWQAMQEEYRLLESHTPEIIAQLQQQGNMVFALTARSTERLVHYTSKQLHTMGIDFSRSGFAQETYVIEGLQHPALYYKGIASCGPNNKGAVLMHLLETFGLKPTKIIFVDDKLKHVEAVRDYAHKHNIPFVGLCYGRTAGTVVKLTQADHLNYHAWVDGLPCVMQAQLH